MTEAKSFDEIECKICGEKGHVLIPHIVGSHGADLCAEFGLEKDQAIEAYQRKFPGAPLLSKFAHEHLERKADELRNEPAAVNVEKAFGVKMAVETVKGWARPWPTTPKIDPDYVFHDKWLLNCILLELEMPNERLGLVGPTGSGKSSGVEQAVARVNKPFYRMNFDGEIGRSEFVGQYVVTGPDRMEFVYGVLPRAMREGAVLLLDEYDMMRSDINGVLQAVLEGKPLVLLETGETIEAHPDFRVFATMNTNGGGDETGLYAGTNIVNYAQRDRWTMFREVNYPDKTAEQKIILKKSGIGEFAKANGADWKDLVGKLIESAKLIRNSFVKDECTCTMSTRSIVQVAIKIVQFGDLREAWNTAYVNKLNTDDKKFVNEVLQRVWSI